MDLDTVKKLTALEVKRQTLLGVEKAMDDMTQQNQQKYVHVTALAHGVTSTTIDEQFFDDIYDVIVRTRQRIEAEILAL